MRHLPYDLTKAVSMRELYRKPLIKLFVLNGAFGAVLGVLFVGLAFAFDLRGLGTLVANSDVAILALVILTFSVSATFAGAAIGTAVMLLPEREEDDKAYGGVDADGNPRRPLR